MKFKVGDRVKLNKNKKTFSYGRAGVSYEEIGIIKNNNKDKYTVNFPSHSSWDGTEDELVIANYTYEDLKKSPIGTKITFENGTVLVKDEEYYFENVSKSRDIANLYNLKDNYSSLGKIIKIEEPEYKTVYESKVEILDEVEKRYLRGVITPFKDSIETIRRLYSPTKEKDYIQIRYKDDRPTNFPYFESNTMYKCMELNKNYTLEELGL